MTKEEVLELIQRDLDGDLAPAEQEALRQALQRNPEYQLMYGRLRRVSDCLAELPRVSPPISLVDAILPRLASDTPEEPAQANEKPQPILPQLERKKADQTAPKRRTFPVWLAKAGSGLVAACLLIGMVYAASLPRRDLPADPYQQGSTPLSSFEAEPTQGAGDAPAAATESSPQSSNPPLSNPSDSGTAPTASESSPSQATETPQNTSAPAVNGGKGNPQGAGSSDKVGSSNAAPKSDKDKVNKDKADAAKGTSASRQEGKRKNPAVGKGNQPEQHEEDEQNGQKQGKGKANPGKPKSGNDNRADDDPVTDEEAVNAEELLPSIVQE